MLKQLCQCHREWLWLSCTLCHEACVPLSTPCDTTGWSLHAQVLPVLGDGVGHSSCQRRKDCKGQHLSQSRQLNASKGNCVTGTTASDEQRSNRAAMSAQHQFEEAISARYQASERTTLPVSTDCSMTALPLPAERRKPHGSNN